MQQHRGAPLQIARIRVHRELGLVLKHRRPHDHILHAGGGAAANAEQQRAIEGDFQVAQDFTAQRNVGQVAGAWKAHGEEGAAGMRMVRTLDSRWNAGGETKSAKELSKKLALLTCK
jgi:hypothetical protein